MLSEKTKEKLAVLLKKKASYIYQLPKSLNQVELNFCVPIEYSEELSNISPDDINESPFQMGFLKMALNLLSIKI